jgi:heme-degrading monooxygenase HmoA
MENDQMIKEFAQVEVLPGKDGEFVAAVNLAVAEVLSTARGFIAFEIYKSVERENVYMFEIQWATLVDHTIGFRESDLFPKWRAIIGPFFASPPQVEHWGLVPAAAGTE